MTRFRDPLHLVIDKRRLTRIAFLLFAAPTLPVALAAIYAVAFLCSFPLLVPVSPMAYLCHLAPDQSPALSN